MSSSQMKHATTPIIMITSEMWLVNVGCASKRCWSNLVLILTSHSVSSQTSRQAGQINRGIKITMVKVEENHIEADEAGCSS